MISGSNTFFSLPQFGFEVSLPLGQVYLALQKDWTQLEEKRPDVSNDHLISKETTLN